MDRIGFDDLPEDVREALELVHIPGQDPLELISALEGISAEYPGFVPARLNLAAIQLQESRPDEAREVYQSVLTDFPDEQGAVAGLATVHAALEDFGPAEELARSALENGYEWPPCYTVIAQSEETRGDIAAASAAFLKAYELSPHAWDNLEQYCRLQQRSFTSPMDEVAMPVAEEQLRTLFEFIDETAHTPDADGNMPGCDHTFRFTTQWAARNNLDPIDLYQFLNAHGGFCDCEVCFNVEPDIFEDDEDFDDDEFDDELEA